MTAASAVTGRGWFHAVLGRWGWTLLGAVLLSKGIPQMIHMHQLQG